MGLFGVRGKKFLEDITPVIHKLKSEWFIPGKSNEEGYQYACGYCDMHCGSGPHDDDCLAELGHETFKQWMKIEKDPKYDTIGFGEHKGVARPAEAARKIRDHAKASVAMKLVPKVLAQVVPLDYGDEANIGICCPCHLGRFDSHAEGVNRRHHPECTFEALAKVVSDVLRPAPDKTCHHDTEELKKLNQHLKDELSTAVQYLYECKLKFAPATTNSDVDWFLDKHQKDTYLPEVKHTTVRRRELLETIQKVGILTLSELIGALSYTWAGVDVGRHLTDAYEDGMIHTIENYFGGEDIAIRNGAKFELTPLAAKLLNME